MKLLKGKYLASKIISNIKNEIKCQHLEPALAVFYIGNNKSSELYVRLKEKAAQKAGIELQIIRLKSGASEKEIVDKIKEINADKKLHGIIVQLPLPEKFDTQRIINAISPSKDVDGFHPGSLKLFLRNKENFYPVFPAAIMNLIKSTHVSLKCKKATVIANSDIFGSIMETALKRNRIKAQYILGNALKSNAKKISASDIIVTAMGKPGIITGKMIKKGAIVIDGGISKKGKKVMGDVDAKSVEKIASFLSPVPGGVGPVTIACLLKNVYLAAINK